jgi:hypothetical protein
VLTSGISFDLQEYNVTVTSPANGCDNTASIKVYFTFQHCSYGLDEQTFSNYLKVYPNPSTDGLFNYEIEGLTGESRIEIFSIQGRLLHGETIQLPAGNAFKSTMNLHNVLPGIYYLKLTNKKLDILRKLVVR